MCLITKIGDINEKNKRIFIFQKSAIRNNRIQILNDRLSNRDNPHSCPSILGKQKHITIQTKFLMSFW